MQTNLTLCKEKPFSTPLSYLLKRIHRAKKQCNNRGRGNHDLGLPHDFLIEELVVLLNDINSHLTEEFKHEKNL